MYHIKRLQCPDCNRDKNERINEILKQIDLWTVSDELRKLMEIFNADKNILAENIKERLQSLVRFSEQWDYRRIQRESVTTRENEAARWLLKDDAFIEENKDLILSSAEALGLIDVTEPVYDSYDYILILGGARYSNLHRAREAAHIVKTKNISGSKIIGLGSMRPISESERETVDTYAPGADTEFDAMEAGLKDAFDTGEVYKEDKYDDDNINLSWRIKYFKDNDNRNEILLMAAPSLDADRRANSADTYEFFFNHFRPEKGSRILICTSSIYIPYQHMKFFENDIRYDVQSDMIGARTYLYTDAVLSKPVNYLQEIRAAIMAMADFTVKFA